MRTAVAPVADTADPFLLGIASGDPLPDAVVLWTRLLRDPLGEPIGEASAQLLGDTARPLSGVGQPDPDRVDTVPQREGPPTASRAGHVHEPSRWATLTRAPSVPRTTLNTRERP